VYVSRLDSTLSVFVSLARSLARPRSLSLSSSFASQRGSVGEPKRSVSQKQRRRQKDSGFKLLLGTRGGGARVGSQQRFDWLIANNSFADWSI
jgi:hypothetical protein